MSINLASRTTRLYKRIKKVPRIFVLVQHQKNEEYVTKTS